MNDFDQAVYNQLKAKYSQFRLPLNWSRRLKPHINKMLLLKSGLETPSQCTPRSVPPRLTNINASMSLNTRKQSVSTFSYHVNSPSNAMLLTQFNPKCNIPIFSTYSSPNKEDGISSNIFSPLQSICNENSSKSTTSFNDALIDVVLKESSPTLKIDSNKLSMFSEFAPFIDYQNLKDHEQKYVLGFLEGSSLASLVLVYSDKSTHIGLGELQVSNDRAKVTGISILIQYNDDAIPVYIKIDPTGQNNVSTLWFLCNLLSNDNIVKVSFNVYQLFIVCSILIRSVDGNADIRNIIDLKIASWMLNSDDCPQSFNELYKNIKGQNMGNLNKQSFYEMLHDYHNALTSLKTDIDIALTEERLTNLFTFLETPLIRIICKMGQTGIAIDRTKLLYLSDNLKAKLSSIESEASAVMKRPINLCSPIQLRDVLYNDLKLDEKIPESITKTSATHEKSTSEECLLKLLDLHPLPRLILRHRRLSKIKSTYVDGIQQYMKYGKLYPSWDQCSTSTGRLTSFNPNIQAFPKDRITGNDSSESKVCVREMITTSSPANKLISVDFCSIEMRILAHFAKDNELINIFKSSSDIFCGLTASWKNIDIKDVTESDRNKTKRVCYAIIYGVGVPKLAQILDVTQDQAKILMKSFLSRFQNLQKFTNAVIDSAKRTKKLRTILNRLRHFPEINCSNFQKRKAIERQAVNFVIQGSAADICKVSMLKLNDYISNNPHINAKLLIQIHDELLYEVYDENTMEFCHHIHEILESPSLAEEVHLTVPLRVKVELGSSWGTLEKYQRTTE